MEHVDCVVVGAGVVGLACARAVALDGLETIILEQEPGIGRGISSRNSEVIHAGIYYPAGSLKAQLCVQGREMIYNYLQQRGLPHRRLGKLLVATEPAELAKLDAIAERARGNGVDSLRWMNGREAVALEPQLNCVAALHSPQTGIIDSHAFMLSLQADLESAGGFVAAMTPMLRARRTGGQWEVGCGGAEPYRIGCDLLINAAGLSAQQVAATIEDLPSPAIPPLRLARGCYFSYSGRSPFQRLIYPVPVQAGLGIHLTLDMGGQARFGPDVQWIDAVDYTVDPARAQGFYAGIRRYWPALPDGCLQPAYAGIRPKLRGPGQADADFLIQGPAQHGVEGLVQLFGIESPGLTSSLAIGDLVRQLAADR
jgi:L-2-hydroxyglutarate oxidase LhgO